MWKTDGFNNVFEVTRKWNHIHEILIWNINSLNLSENVSDYFVLEFDNWVDYNNYIFTLCF